MTGAEEVADWALLHAQRRTQPCPNGRCEHSASNHCHHGDGVIHCTDGCRCTNAPTTEEPR